MQRARDRSIELLRKLEWVQKLIESVMRYRSKCNLPCMNIPQIINTNLFSHKISSRLGFKNLSTPDLES